MCTCIDNIKASYSDVRRKASQVSHKSFAVPKSNVDAELNIDTFLDAINLITKELYRLTTAVNNLVETVRNNFCDITVNEAQELLQLSTPISEKMSQLHDKLLKSPLYVGMETVVNIYTEAMNDFNELCHDLKFFRVELETNDRFQQTLSKLNLSLVQ